MERLRQLRLARGWTLDELARRLEGRPSRAALSLYERGASRPRPAYLQRLARALEVRPAQLLGESRLALRWTGFRKHASLGKKAQEALEARAAWRAERHFWLEDSLATPPAGSWPEFEGVVSMDDAEEAASALRRSWGLGELPIADLTTTVEELGVAVLAEDQDERFDGLSGWAQDRRPVVVLNRRMPADRRRFSLAHELGHLFVKPALNGMKQERLLHRFAAALLVPAPVARRELGPRRRSLSFPELKLLKERFGFSIAAWVRRAFDLGIVPQSVYRWWNVQIRKRGWHEKEPGEYRAESPPRRTRQLLLHALAEGLVTEDWARKLLSKGKGPHPRAASARALLSLPREERTAILEESAASALEAYETDPEWTDFFDLDTEDFED